MLVHRTVTAPWENGRRLRLCCHSAVCVPHSQETFPPSFLTKPGRCVCMWRRGRTGRPATQAATRRDPWQEAAFKEAATGILPLSLPQHHCAPLCTGTGAHLQSTRPFHLSTQLQDTFFQEELGKSSSEEGSSGLESHPYLALPVIHAGRLIFSFECSMVVSKRKLYSLASPCRLLLPSRTYPMPDFKTLKGAYLQGELNVTPRISANPYHLM